MRIRVDIDAIILGAKTSVAPFPTADHENDSKAGKKQSKDDDDAYHQFVPVSAGPFGFAVIQRREDHNDGTKGEKEGDDGETDASSDAVAATWSTMPLHFVPD